MPTETVVAVTSAQDTGADCSHHSANAGASSLAATPLAGETPETIARLAQTYASHFRPANAVEADLVREMVVARLQMRRCSALRERLLDLETQSIPGSPSNNLSALGRTRAKSGAFHGLADNLNAIRLLNRYARRSLRAHLSGFRRLLNIRATAKAKLLNETL